MLYVERDATGTVVAVHSEPTPDAQEELPLGHPDLIDFLAQGNASDEVRQRLFASDFDMARITEDLIQTLIDKGVFNFTDLPDNAQEKLRLRRVLRGQLGSLSGLIDDDTGL